MRGDYIVARENFKEAERHVSAEKDPVMFNLIFALQSLADQIASDFAELHEAVAKLSSVKPHTAGPATAARKGRAAAKPSGSRKGRRAASPSGTGLRKARSPGRPRTTATKTRRPRR
jgi:hypothetical protein